MPARVHRPSPIALARIGMSRLASGDYPRAAEAFQAAAEAAPGEPVLWNNLAMARVGLGELDAAVVALRRSLGLDPGQVETWNSLATALSRLGRADEAFVACDAALALDPDCGSAWHLLGVLHIGREDFAKAAAALARAIDLVGDRADLCLNLGVSLLKCGRFEDAERRLTRAVCLDPASGAASKIKRLCDFILAAIGGDMGAAKAAYPADAFDDQAAADRIFRTALLYLDWSGRGGAAAAVGEAWVAARGDSVEAIHLRDAVLSRPVPRQPAALVAQHFDGIANDFDERLVRRLDYRGPEQLGALIAARLPANADLDVLDLGCGTGLCGGVLRPYARRLEGVDLSPGMLARARAGGQYDQLEVADLHAALTARAARWDLLVAADTFPYLGDLAPVFEAARTALRRGGWFAFTTETTDQDGYRLRGNGRYAHDPAYVRRLADGRFEVAGHVTAPLRREGGDVVEGDAWLLRRLD